MDIDSLPDPEPHPEPRHPAPPHKKEAREPRRYWIKALVAVYALSVIAGFVLVGKKPAGKKGAATDADSSSLSSGLSLLSKKTKKPGIGWIKIQGVIRGREAGGLFDKRRKSVVRKLRAMGKRKDVKAIVLEIDSPGGTVGTVQEIYDQILRVREKENKPVIALLNDVAASGGYYVAAACDKIVAHRGTITGSIGVIFGATEWVELLKKIGVKSNPIKSGKFKDIGSASRTMTEEERTLLQAIIDDSYEQFVEDIKKGRGMPDEAVRKYADGRIFNGRQALSYGFVDELGGAIRAVELAKTMGEIEGEPRIIRDGEPLEKLAEIFGEVRSPGLDSEGFIEKLESLSAPSLEYRWAGGF